jgi:hypothetical protein
VAIAGIAGAASLLGLILVGSLAGASSAHQHGAATGAAAELDGLALSIEVSEWMAHDMTGGAMPPTPGGFQMPSSMMPNMPAPGMRRLHLEVVVSNRGGAAKEIAPREFSVVSSGGEWPAAEGSFDPATIRLGATVAIDVYFDVAETAGDLQLIWRRAGQQADVALNQPGHAHD